MNESLESASAASRTPGRLVVVGTPIGNLGDLSTRAKEALADADAIACEDSRRTGRLLQLSGLERRPYLVANEHTEVRRAREIVDRVAAGEVIALVSDAGMPGVSDPGERIVAAVVDAGLDVDVVPGPTAAVSALVVSGLSTSRFAVEGFIARKGRERDRQIQEIATRSMTTVLYESPKRVVALLADLAGACGSDRRASVSRELTKLYQTTERGTLGELGRRLSLDETRGEYVVVLGGAPIDDSPVDDLSLIELLDLELAGGASTRDAVAAVVAATGASKRHVYDLANLR